MFGGQGIEEVLNRLGEESRALPFIGAWLAANQASLGEAVDTHADCPAGQVQAVHQRPLAQLVGRTSPGERPQWVPAPGLRYPGRDAGRGDPEAAVRVVFPGLAAGTVATCYLLGVSTRRMEKLVESLGITRLSRSQVSEMARDEQVEAFRTRPLDAGPYTFVAADALVLKVREGGRVVNVHALLAAGVACYRASPMVWTSSGSASTVRNHSPYGGIVSSGSRPAYSVLRRRLCVRSHHLR
jgi:Transposase, Mutator family